MLWRVHPAAGVDTAQTQAEQSGTSLHCKWAASLSTSQSLTAEHMWAVATATHLWAGVCGKVKGHGSKTLIYSQPCLIKPQARAAVELETQRTQLQAAAEAAAARQREVEAQNKLLHERLEKIEAGQASGDVPTPGEPEFLQSLHMCD